MTALRRYFCVSVTLFWKSVDLLIAEGLKYIHTRRSGFYATILLAPAEGWGRALRALLGAFGPLFSNIKNLTLFVYLVRTGIYSDNRRSGRYAPIHQAPAEGWGALWALLGAFGPQ